MEAKCKNCGAGPGLHHFETLQCPAGGYEAPVGKKQRWGSTTYATDDRTSKEKAAPLLYEACKALIYAADNRENTMGDPCRLLQVQAELRAAAKNARAAIAAAEKGE